MESTSDLVAVKIIEIKTKDLGYYIDLIDKAKAGFKRMDSSFERSSTMRKMLAKNIACYREILVKSQSMQQTSLSYFNKLPQPPQSSATITLNSQQQLALRQNPPPSKRLWFAERSIDNIFSKKVFLIKVLYTLLI